ncbi:heme/copper-type cytochrome/quinol oxidase, subunit 3 [Solemya velum gill symbiont]|uniref:cytochrome-c oxidase n=1 Tax=Solemya velum gill symbiont TaxID=2340 RepID=A0A0B0H1H1_SOVGS|nr:cytochrome c oxidase subunit 3 [Solemya velum gill symbiont]KHF24063.1 heme/copper-type cytochrome/quinol oxidase, subunit 3 [Solemya velum gill symbiont]
MTTTSNDDYYIPEPSRWPLIGAATVFTLLFGVVLWLNSWVAGPWIMLAGAASLAFLFKGWFGDVIKENLSGSYNGQVDSSFRQGMFWFITSEVFFFLTFFGCLYYLRNITLPYLGGEGYLATSNILWEGWTYTWPPLQLPDATNYVEAKEAMGPGGIPLWNTIILLSSGGTLTWAHWALKKDDNKQLVLGLATTILLGVIFFILQAVEYGHAYAEMDLTLESGIYGSTFYLLTGFHGFHVTVGAIMLMVILGRAMKNHFSSHNHFAFEAVAWYWHFVDVVWIGLYILVYWL